MRNAWSNLKDTTVQLYKLFINLASLAVEEQGDRIRVWPSLGGD